MVLSGRVGLPGMMTSDIDQQVESCQSRSLREILTCDLVKLRILCNAIDVLLTCALLFYRISIVHSIIREKYTSGALTKGL